MANRHLSLALKIVLTALIVQLSILSAVARADNSNDKKNADVDFPPGTFSDGQHYKLSDFQGKVLVIFFYESTCPHCAARMPAYDALFKKFKDKPIKFIAIGAHDSLTDVKEYIATNKLHVPFFADPLSLMGASYNTGKISLENVIQFRVIGPDGISSGNLSIPMPTEDEINALVKNVKWKYKDDGYNPALNQAIDLLEWNQFESGMRVLRPFLKSYDKAVADSAQKLYDRVKTEGQGWKDEADKEQAANPVDAYDLYSRVSTVFAGDDLAKSVDKPLQKLKTTKAITDELEARQLFSQLYPAMARVNAKDKNAAAQVAKFCNNLITKYPGTPTADRADHILKNLAASGF